MNYPEITLENQQMDSHIRCSDVMLNGVCIGSLREPAPNERAMRMPPVVQIGHEANKKTDPKPKYIEIIQLPICWCVVFVPELYRDLGDSYYESEDDGWVFLKFDEPNSLDKLTAFYQEYGNFDFE